MRSTRTGDTILRSSPVPRGIGATDGTPSIKNSNLIKNMKSVVLCGSRRFKPEIIEFGKKLKELGVTVFEPHLLCGQDEWNNLSQEYKDFIILGLTHDHFHKIRMANIVFVFNKDGYVGNSTTLEIGYAVALGKPVFALSPDEELSRNVLFREIIQTPEDLFKRL